MVVERVVSRWWQVVAMQSDSFVDVATRNRHCARDAHECGPVTCKKNAL